MAREHVDIRGYVDPRTRLDTDRDVKELRVRYLLVEVNTSYDILMGKPCLNAFGVIILTPHLSTKFTSDKGTIVRTIWVDQKIVLECYVAL